MTADMCDMVITTETQQMSTEGLAVLLVGQVRTFTAATCIYRYIHTWGIPQTHTDARSLFTCRREASKNMFTA